MASRKLEDLNPPVAEKRELVALAEAEGIELLITSTLRTFEEHRGMTADN